VSTIEITCCAQGRAEIIDYGTYPEGLLWVLTSDTSKLLHDCPFCGARLPDDLGVDRPLTVADVESSLRNLATRPIDTFPEWWRKGR